LVADIAIFPGVGNWWYSSAAWRNWALFSAELETGALGEIGV
jgi:hypothetical protein